MKTEHSRDHVPLDAALVEIPLDHRERWFSTPECWVFANPATGRPYHQDSIQQDHLREAGKEARLGDGIGWKNICGKAMSDSKRDANSNVVKMILKPKKIDAVEVQSDQIAATGS